MQTDINFLNKCKQTPQKQLWTVYASRHQITIQLKIANYAVATMQFNALWNRPTSQTNVHLLMHKTRLLGICNYLLWKLMYLDIKQILHTQIAA